MGKYTPAFTRILRLYSAVPSRSVLETWPSIDGPGWRDGARPASGCGMWSLLLFLFLFSDEAGEGRSVRGVVPWDAPRSG